MGEYRSLLANPPFFSPCPPPIRERSRKGAIRHFSSVPPSRGGSGWLDPRTSSLSRRSSPSTPFRSTCKAPKTDTRISSDDRPSRMMMSASPARLQAKDSSTTTTTVTSATPAGSTPALLSSNSTTISTPATTSTISPVSPVAASNSSCSPVLTLTGSRSDSPGSVSRAQQHKSKRNSLTSSCDSGGSDSPRIVYGPGTIARLPSELGRLQLSKPLIVSSPSRIALARRIQALIPNFVSRILDSAVVNVPTRVVDDAVARISGHDVVISVGAGSAIGLAKAVSIRKGIPHICIPTTYSGSELSPLLAADGRKMGHKGSKLMPTVIIYDEDLTGLNAAPKIISAPSAAASTAIANRRSSNDDDASWSYIHLPGV